MLVFCINDLRINLAGLAFVTVFRGTDCAKPVGVADVVVAIGLDAAGHCQGTPRPVIAFVEDTVALGHLARRKDEELDEAKELCNTSSERRGVGK